jgi:hypothetical protein
MTLIGLSTSTETEGVRFIQRVWLVCDPELNFAYAKYEADVASLNITVSAKKSSCYA